MVSPSFTLKKSAPNSASAVDYDTHFKIVQRVKISPLSVMGSPSLETESRKKCPDAQLFASFADRWDASECLFNNISDA